MKKIILYLFLLFNLSMEAQNKPLHNTFDFWVGNWNAWWNDSLRGTNSITKTLKNTVVEENFSFNDGSFLGKSWTLYDATTNSWKQTWVDDTGAYLLFTGGKEDDKVILNMTEPRTKNGNKVYMRMVFFNISHESFDWDWQSSEDKINWKSTWAIHYKRK